MLSYPISPGAGGVGTFGGGGGGGVLVDGTGPLTDRPSRSQGYGAGGGNDAAEEHRGFPGVVIFDYIREDDLK